MVYRIYHHLWILDQQFIYITCVRNLLDFVLASLDDDMGSRINEHEHEQSIDEIGVQGTPTPSDDEPAGSS